MAGRRGGAFWAPRPRGGGVRRGGARARGGTRPPTIGPRRDQPVRFAGSWSVRLAGKGFHANHVHPAGWISSALYVALPERGPDDSPNAGWLALGSPEAGLGLDISPTRLIEPKPGRLVMFPSTMWHGTVPFDAGERLTVAFDVAPPMPGD
ncbi:MAG: hypothetical protein IPO97_10290 [Sphingomonadales bacterium]|nr:hypothetical protein [Sphingomonadales bacterium]